MWLCIKSFCIALSITQILVEICWNIASDWSFVMTIWFDFISFHFILFYFISFFKSANNFHSSNYLHIRTLFLPVLFVHKYFPIFVWQCNHLQLDIVQSIYSTIYCVPLLLIYYFFVEYNQVVWCESIVISLFTIHSISNYCVVFDFFF